MRILALAILTLATVSAVPAARAQTYDPKYPVCLQVYQGFVDYYFECAYTSMPQCQMSASGRAASIEARRIGGTKSGHCHAPARERELTANDRARLLRDLDPEGGPRCAFRLWRF